MSLILFLMLVILYALFVVAQTPMATCAIGRNTAYQTNGMAGSCSYGSLTGPMGPGYLYVTALNEKWFNGSYWCGVCFQVSGPSASVRIMVTDMCPGTDAICAGDMNHFDLSTEALAVIALRLLQQDWELQGTTIGKNSTDLKIFDSVPSNMVSCDVTGNVKLQFASGSSQYWVGILLANHRVGIEQLEFQETGQPWRLVKRSTYGRWDFSTQGPLPFNIRLTSMTAPGGVPEVQTAQITSVTPLQVIDLGFQFSDPKPAAGCGSACPLSYTLPIVFDDVWFPGRPGSASFTVGQDWQQTGWSQTVSIVTTPTYSGSGAVSVSLAAYGGFGILSGFGVTKEQATGMELYISAKSGTLSNLFWNVNDDTANKVALGAVTTTYKRLFVDFSKFTVPISKFVITNELNGVSAFYVDEWKFLMIDQTTTCAAASTTTVPPTSTVAPTTPTATTTPPATTTTPPTTAPQTSSTDSTSSTSTSTASNTLTTATQTSPCWKKPWV